MQMWQSKALFTQTRFQIYMDTQICIHVQKYMYTDTKHLHGNDFSIFGDVMSWP